ncbi:unnamed protein product [Acanthoscelides obtectus]|uniref:Uncharacterized protein n=1 Tax=Acanthoscelides obtectus TaxID=200917 RepID=A0A9P0MDW6_ACAOB|nr:unnamed protein product [Acanthoscelides obtectus]CAK1684185.1 hypothetical protein AOBTE_LOCUS34692 [Acanthoscelides obtectus]
MLSCEKWLASPCSLLFIVHRYGEILRGPERKEFAAKNLLTRNLIGRKEVSKGLQKDYKINRSERQLYDYRHLLKRRQCLLMINWESARNVLCCTVLYKDSIKEKG